MQKLDFSAENNGFTLFLKDVFSLHFKFNKKKVLAALILLMALAALATALLLKAYQGGIPVLNYHQINSKDHNALTVSTEQFAAQMAYLHENDYHTITPDELGDALENGTPLPENPVLITFDDGYLDNYKNAYPILKQYSMTATIFLITDYVSTYPNYLTWDQALEMQDNGICLQSHTLSHVDLRQVDDQEALAQLKTSKDALEWHLHNKVHYLAYPCGSYDDEIKALARQAGYRGAFTVNYGLDRQGNSLFALNRIPIFGGNSHTLMRFKLRLKLTPLLTSLGQLKNDLNKNGHPSLAAWIPIP